MDNEMNVRPSVGDSILSSTKKLLGIPLDSFEFDPDICMFINSAIGTLTQLGIGPSNGYIVMNEDQTFFDFLGKNAELFPQVQTFLFYKTKIGWDNSTMSSSVLATMKEEIKEIEFRLQVTADHVRGGEFNNGKNNDT